MRVKAGDIRRFTYAGRAFPVVGDSNVNIRLTGKGNEVNMNGDGSAFVTQRARPAGIADLPVNLDPALGDLEYLQGKQTEGTGFPTTITLAGGQVYSGDLAIVSDLDHSTGDGQVSLELRGEKFESI